MITIHYILWNKLHVKFTFTFWKFLYFLVVWRDPESETVDHRSPRVQLAAQLLFLRSLNEEIFSNLLYSGWLVCCYLAGWPARLPDWCLQVIGWMTCTLASAPAWQLAADAAAVSLQERARHIFSLDHRPSYREWILTLITSRGSIIMGMVC